MQMANSNIIIIHDLLATKERKEKELQFYHEELKKLEERMHWLRMEIKLTNDIIKMIEREQILDIKTLIKETK